MVEKQADVAGVGVSHIERVFALLRERLPRVLEANRFFEEETGLHNEAGTNNIVDAFSHLATLVEQAHELDDYDQGEQVAHLEDHLRRSMMEAFEQVVKLRLADVADRWEEHRRKVRPLQARGSLQGVASSNDLAAERARLKELLEKGRATKRGASWEDWEDGTDFLVQACEVSERLLQELENAIAVADEAAHRRRTRLIAAAGMLCALAVGIAIGAAAFG